VSDGKKKEGHRAGYRIDGVRAAAELLAGLEPTHRERLMKEMSAVNPGMTQNIRGKLFVFEDLARLEPAQFQKLFHETPRARWVLALRRTTPEMTAFVHGQLSLRAREELQEEVALQGPKRVSDIAAAQAELVEQALKRGYELGGAKKPTGT
jgi:flagellar motor switch protein FliG